MKTFFKNQSLKLNLTLIHVLWRTVFITKKNEYKTLKKRRFLFLLRILSVYTGGLPLSALQDDAVEVFEICERDDAERTHEQDLRYGGHDGVAWTHAGRQLTCAEPEARHELFMRSALSHICSVQCFPNIYEATSIFKIETCKHSPVPACTQHEPEGMCTQPCVNQTLNHEKTLQLKVIHKHVSTTNGKNELGYYRGVFLLTHIRMSCSTCIQFRCSVFSTHCTKSWFT